MRGPGNEVVVVVVVYSCKVVSSSNMRKNGTKFRVASRPQWRVTRNFEFIGRHAL